MTLTSIADPEGFRGAAIPESAQWRPVPAIKLGTRQQDRVLLWNWQSSAVPEESFQTSPKSAAFLTIPNQLQRSVVESAKRKVGETGEVGGIEGLIALADATRIQLQSIQSRSSKHKGLLDDFLQLQGSADRDILAFARRWGPLYLCRHAKPYLHNAPGRYDYDPSQPCSPNGFTRAMDWGWERLEDWRRYSRDATEILNKIEIAWKLPKPLRFKSRTFQDALVEVNEWLAEAGAVLTIEFDPTGDEEPSYGVSESAGVFGLLGLQLISTLTRSTSPSTCASCGVGFSPERQPPTGTRRYCVKCRRNGAPARDASRDHYRRKKQVPND